MKRIFILVAIPVLIIMGCHTNSLTGRTSFRPIPVENKQLFPQSFAAYNKTLKANKTLDKNSKEAKMVTKVGKRIRNAAEQFYKRMGDNNTLQGFEWEYSVIESDQPNAWCMPGGKIAFYTGILPICKDETGVAVVMGHEVVHAIAGHSAEQISKGQFAQLLAVGGGAAISSAQWQNIFNQYFPTVAGATLLHYNRKMELESDNGGLKLMAYAGYDPREAVNFWQRMAAKSKGQQRPPEFLSTHPDPGNRIAEIKRLLPEAIKIYNASPYKGK